MKMFIHGKCHISQIQHKTHDGLDIVADQDITIYSNINGIIDFAGWENSQNRRKGFGLYLRIKENNTNNYHYFGHLSEIFVKKGDNIIIGMPLGVQGNTGNSTGRHTHYCIRKNKSKLSVLNASEYLGVENKIYHFIATWENLPNKKSIEDIAKDVIALKYGVGEERKHKLEALGYNYRDVQNKVNELLKCDVRKLTNAEIEKIAKDVIALKYGVGEERRHKLEALGYDYKIIQNRVNEILRG